MMEIGESKFNEEKKRNFFISDQKVSLHPVQLTLCSRKTGFIKIVWNEACLFSIPFKICLLFLWTVFFKLNGYFLAKLFILECILTLEAIKLLD